MVTSLSASLDIPGDAAPRKSANCPAKIGTGCAIVGSIQHNRNATNLEADLRRKLAEDGLADVRQGDAVQL